MNKKQGRALAIDSGDKFLMRECAGILEQMKQFQEAADMYVRAECYEKGAGIFIRIKVGETSQLSMCHSRKRPLHFCLHSHFFRHFSLVVRTSTTPRR
jgi:hypothetical protein